MSKKYPHFKQLHSRDCGIVCLRMIAQFYGKFYNTEQLRSLAHQKAEGVSLLNISEASEQIGMHTVGAKLSYRRLIEDIPLPGIAHWKENHFVVVYEANENQVTVGDPDADQLITISTQEFLNGWIGNSSGYDQEGIILLMEPTAIFFTGENKPSDRNKSFFLWENLKSYKKLLVFLAVAIVVGALLAVTFPFIIQLIVDESIEQENADLLPKVLLAWIVLFISQIGLDFLRRFLLFHIGAKLNIKLLTDFIVRLLQLPVTFFQSRMTDDVMQTLYDNPRVHRFFTKDAVSVIYASFIILLFLLVLLAFNSKIFLTVAIFAAVQVLFVRFFIKKRKALNYNRHKFGAERYSRLTDLIRGIRDIKLANAEQTQRWAWERSEAQLFKVGRSYSLSDELSVQVPFSLGELRNILVIYFAAVAVIEGSMTIGVMVATLFILTQLNGPIRQLIEFFLSWQEAKLGLERMNEVFHYDKEMKGEKIDILPQEGILEGENLSFQYEGEHSPWVISNLNFHIPKGKTTAVVGPNGSGKSTFLNLLTTFLQPQEGILKFGQIRLSDFQSATWLGHCGVVSQDGHLFYDTIARNIVLGEESIDSKRMIEAAKIANILPFLERLQNGFYTMVGEGGIGLSKAQRQGILIARAIYKQPEILLLDEATNDLDAQNETVVLNRIEEAFKGRTVVIFTSRINLPIRIDNVIPLATPKVKAETRSHLANSKGGNGNVVPDNFEEVLHDN
ncbi:MAG: peptidase domain-containing ABC transporter [Saprospiraceae bacterium]|nr:peptidase domain-containing ABC transporter [Saprospiraceae bacterium]MCF8248408.1 peptidase domain-containing ABC transporter [Saprospiraceae bacterium]MCF8280079.1 peptidase domain-containing ABC transporter [Bacteroidales bacterium]MCF8309936.1 peptidase domain-containing ABC transporter [Saprospiraceae bacterium]MCF8438733.1 peptidase domain-containing ABC transporter [Saprospiraceae bacterium]